VLAGNPATSAAILSCLNTVDASGLRQLHAAVAAVVANVPWCGINTPVQDAVRWRAALPAAVGAMPGGHLKPTVLAALTGVTNLHMHNCRCVTDELLFHLLLSLRTLNVSYCSALTDRASFVHLTALTSLDCCMTSVVERGAAGLPTLLQELIIASMLARVSLSGLTRLRGLRAWNLDAPAAKPALQGSTGTPWRAVCTLARATHTERLQG